jgi:hypothetical protein
LWPQAHFVYRHDHRGAYMMLADALTGLQAQLPPDLVRTERQPADPPEVVEVWFST